MVFVLKDFFVLKLLLLAPPALWALLPQQSACFSLLAFVRRRNERAPLAQMTFLGSEQPAAREQGLLSFVSGLPSGERSCTVEGRRQTLWRWCFYWRVFINSLYKGTAVYKILT